jgi:hypothetical protein
MGTKVLGEVDERLAAANPTEMLSPHELCSIIAKERARAEAAEQRAAELNAKLMICKGVSLIEDVQRIRALERERDELAAMLTQCVGYANGPTRSDEVDLYSLGHSHDDTNAAIAQALIDEARALLARVRDDCPAR